MGKVTPHPSATGGPQLRPPEALSKDHNVADFDCGKPELNQWLVQRAATSEGKSARTYVVAVDSRVVGYYSLAAGSVMRGDLPNAKLRQNMPEQVPVIVFGRLAVDQKFAGRGFGKGLLKVAITRAIEASEIVGARAIIVHAIDDDACGFYRKFGFLPFSTSSRTLILPIETAKQAL